MTVRVPVGAELLAWARKRSRIAPDELASRFPDLHAWEHGEKQPTLKQLEKFANATHTPVGYLFRPAPPEEGLPVPDFRTVGDAEVGEASPDLLDTVYQCQQRQDWYRDYARVRREGPAPFVGTMTVDTAVVEAARVMRDVLAYQPRDRGSSWAEAFRNLIEASDRNGVLVMVSGIVGSNTHRKLDPEEFRGFALADELAPLVFVNGASALLSSCDGSSTQACYLKGVTGVFTPARRTASSHSWTRGRRAAAEGTLQYAAGARKQAVRAGDH